jgi:hypothetical protein
MIRMPNVSEVDGPMATLPTTTRRSHYENAFEHYLTARGVPFVAVSDVKRAVPGRLGIKAFDYIVYPASQPPCLIDVKGRKFARATGRVRRRWESWVTQADVDGLVRWREIFGEDFTAAFVFGYWLSNVAAPPDGPEYHTLAGRLYGFWGVELENYRRFAKVRSVRWKTLDLPVEQFIRLAWPLTRWDAQTPVGMVNSGVQIPHYNVP